jgi:hypothetical protein
MTSHACPDCDVPGEGNCGRCCGRGRIPLDKYSSQFGEEVPCPRCKGSGVCSTCEGTGTVEVRGASG